jgi:hypothetical protein
VCSAVPSRGRQIASFRLAPVLAAWREFLGITQLLRTQRISPFQVTDENGRVGCALIGVTFDARTATIYHTRGLTTEDLIHELLHVAHPLWSEANVVHETERLWRPGLRVPPQADVSIVGRYRAA